MINPADIAKQFEKIGNQKQVQFKSSFNDAYATGVGIIIEFTRKYMKTNSELLKSYDRLEPRFIHVIISVEEEMGDSKASENDLVNL